MQRNMLAALIAGLFTLPVQAQQIPSLDAIIVTATRIPSADVSAPYASEIHTQKMIEQSGAASLFDYLAQHTSVQVQPSYGNRFTPMIDMRGYGGNGYQNIVISLDGRRLNNVDMTPQLIGSIPLADIERIEITKGSGSLMFGDGAMAGSIQIYTRAHQGVTLAASVGNHGMLTGTATAGMSTEKLTLSASADYASLDGYSARDPSGHTDESSSRSWRGSLAFRPVERLELGLDAASTRIDVRYSSPLSLAQFKADPAQVGSNPWASPANAYNHQNLSSDQWGIGLKAALATGLDLSFKHYREDKLSAYPTWHAGYDYDSDDLGLRYATGAFDMAGGVQRFDGVRSDRNGFGDNDTGKRNLGYYLHGQYRLDRTTFSAGARREKVEYRYAPTAAAASQAEHNLTAWDLGMNQRIDDRLTVFANINRAFQAPDIDRFFDYGGTFNGFITPAISRTLNLGLNHVTPVNRLKLTLFRSNLDHEIYYNPDTYANTNLDKTHKYGLELQDSWRATDSLTANFNYTYTRALIDHEDEAGGTYDGKSLPGVPRHGVVLGLAWQASPAASLGLTHAWRSSTFAVEDFSNSFSQKQAAYQSTDLSLRYRLKNWEWFAAVNNLFERQNGLWIHDDAIYPINFTRNWRVGMKATF